MDSNEVWKSEFLRVWGNKLHSEFDTPIEDNRYSQIKYHMIRSNECVNNLENLTHPEELYIQGLEHLSKVFKEEGMLDGTRINAIYCNPLVQVIVSHSVEKLVTDYLHKNPCRDDLYQETYIITRKITEGFYRKHKESQDITNNYLGYLRKYLYLKLRRCYLMRYLGYKRKNDKYVVPQPVVDPLSISGHDSLDESLIVNEEKCGLLEYVGQKNQRYAEVINYRVFYDLTLQQVADVIQKPLGTVKSDINRSKPLVKRWMNKSRAV